MTDELTDRVKKLFEEMGGEPLVILKTPNAGQTVDNNHGVEFPLPEYAVIHKGDINKNYDILEKFKEKEGIDVMDFDEEGCKPSIQRLVDELKQDAYEVVYTK